MKQVKYVIVCKSSELLKEIKQKEKSIQHNPPQIANV